MQKAQAVMTLFGVPDAVGHSEGRMFATFGGLQVFLNTTDAIEIGPMKIDARMDDGAWIADRASLVGYPELPAASKTPQADTLKLVSTGPGAVIEPASHVGAAEAKLEMTAAAAIVSPELAKVPETTVPRSAFANLERGSKHAAAEAAKPPPAVTVVAPAPAQTTVSKPTPAATGGAFSGLSRARGSMPSQAARNPGPSSSGAVVPLKAAGAAITARPAFDPSDASFKDIPF